MPNGILSSVRVCDRSAARGPFSIDSLQWKIATLTTIMRGYLRAPSSEALRVPL